MSRHERQPGIVNINIFNGGDCPDCPGEWDGPWAPDNTHGNHDLLALYTAASLTGAVEGDEVTVLEDQSGNGYDTSKNGSAPLFLHVDNAGKKSVITPNYGSAGMTAAVPAQGNNPVTLMVAGMWGGGPASIGDSDYTHVMGLGPDHLYGFYLNDLYYGGRSGFEPTIVFLTWDGTSIQIFAWNKLLVAFPSYDPMDLYDSLGVLQAGQNTSWYAMALWNGFLEIEDRKAALDWMQTKWMNPRTVASLDTAPLRAWYQVNTQGLSDLASTTFSDALQYNLADRAVAGFDNFLGDLTYIPDGLPYVQPTAARYYGGIADRPLDNKARSVVWAGDPSTGTCFACGHADDDFTLWGITGEKLILDISGANDVNFTTPVRGGPTVLFAQYDPDSQKTSVWDRDVLVLEYTHPDPLTTGNGLFLFDTTGSDSSGAAINSFEDAFYGYAFWEGLLTSDQRAGMIGYFKDFFVGWNDVTRTDGANFSVSGGAGDPPEHPVQRYTGNLLGFSGSGPEWWQLDWGSVAYPVSRLVFVPWVDGGDFVGVPHIELVASNTGDFMGEEVQLLDEDTDNTDFKFNVFDLANTDAYAYYRVNFSGLESGRLGVRQLFFYRDQTDW